MKHKVTIGIIGDFDPERVYHRATNAALDHAAGSLGLELQTEWRG